MPAPQCLQALDNGQCKAPVVDGSKFCRHHDPQRPKQVSAEAGDIEPLDLPPLLDRPSMLVALNQVAQALAANRIKRSVAVTLLAYIKLASRLVTEIGEAGSPGLPAHQNRDESLRDLDELLDAMQNGTPDEFRKLFLAMQKKGAEQAKSRPSAPALQPQKTPLPASGNSRKPVQAFSLSDQSSDRFVAEMMAQANELLAKAPKPDPRFLRA